VSRAPSLLLCTDLDRTLIPNGTQSESPGARTRFRTLAEHPEVTLVYVSGRHRGLIEQAISNFRLPQPGIVVADVGTNIYKIDGNNWDVHQGWQAEIAPDWNGYDRTQLRTLLVGFGALRIQAFNKQNTYKLSYYVPLHADHRRLDADIGERLGEHGIEASLVWSIDEPAGVGLLDILPLRATKLHAVEFLCASLKVAVRDTLFAGDSGNDLPVLASNVPAVLVANALPAVAKAALQDAERLGNLEWLYLARGDFLGMNGNYAAGILEGVAHFHPGMI
jgi:HAD superfamily hydrolase (TIGR01484 family)